MNMDGENSVKLESAMEIIGPKVIICGTARNVSRKIDSFVAQMDKSFKEFDDVQYLICESFSTDDTLRVLNRIKDRKKNFDFFSDSNISMKEHRRTVRIASARNEIVKKIRTSYPEIDYVVMADLDGVNRDLNSRAIQSCWQIPEWDMVSASQPLRYYDIWALRADGWVECDCWKEFEELKKEYSSRKARRIAVTSKMRSIRRCENPIQVQSAFGGFAIYTRAAFIEGTYRGADSNGDEICEHIPFHKDLLGKGYKLYINPKLVNLNEFTQIGNIIKEFLIKLLGKR
jgi:glycosyltransferase involved in cell wall biosynthesis